ncbi:ERMES complex subunit [Pseudogymnoascus australis]
MAFNFNWSPLTADAEFYLRAQEMLTTALNKNPKPPIIVDDILVSELNLGSVPPDLEILEIGDLAEDRFRGIFKMCYSGDAFLTLKTRVQANPMNTYLFSKPSFTSPQPLAASSGLTIPLKITLSDIKLSAFIILVFSRQKGLTLVFRNDPLESIKVSSTFDSIPFVCEYLQKEIEIQLRTLMMEELPAIIHRLSLRLWCPEYAAKEEEERLAEEKQKAGEVATDPLASPPQDAVDSHGNVFDSREISSLSLEDGVEGHSLFSQKNLLRLGVLSDSQRTFSLFTPAIRDAVFRAWAGPGDRGDGLAITPPTLTRTHSAVNNGATTYTFSDHESEGSLPPSRPSLSHLPSATTGLSLGAGRHRTHGRKKRHRVVNLRKQVLNDTLSEGGDSETTDTDSSVMGGSEPIMSTRVPEAPVEEPITPPHSQLRFRPRLDSIDLGETPRTLRQRAFPREKSPSDYIRRGSQMGSLNNYSPYPYEGAAQGGIIEQAWMMSMAAELARRAHLRKQADGSEWGSERRDETPPPAYGV